MTNVAITNCPVNTDTRLEVLAKSLRDCASGYAKSLTMGAAHPTPSGPQTGAGAGAILAPESLEKDARDLRKPKRAALSMFEDEDEAETPPRLSKAQAVAYVRTRNPHLSRAQAVRLVQVAFRRSST